jgi:putative transposase
VKYEFIKQHKHEFSVLLMCEVFQVSTSGYYDWDSRTVSARDSANQLLDKKIMEIYMQHHKRYGSPRITKVLKAQDILCSHTRVERRMKHLGICAVARRKFKVTTDSEHNNPVFENKLDRDFSTTDINQKWVSDITYVYTSEGWLYLAVVIDIHSRSVIGWAMSSRMKKDIVCDALIMALFKRKFPKKIIIHSDRGSQYCSNKYRRIIKNNKLIGSMSRKGNCWDNAIAESFFHTLKTELIHLEKYKTREEAKSSIFQYIVGYYNLVRMHSALDYRAPNEVELAA